MHYADTNAHDNTDRHAHGYFDGNSNGDANAYIYSYCVADSYAKTFTHAASSSDASASSLKVVSGKERRVLRQNSITDNL